ncbi:MAG: hypothetical protein ACOYNC_03035 [Bacteroidales bacterium]
MIRVFFLAVVLIANLTLKAQVEGVQPNEPAFIAKYADIDFKGKFALSIEPNALTNYYLLDFSKLPSRFEKVYYMNLSFSSGELINIDPVITKSRVCFMSNKQYPEADVIAVFEKIKRIVADTSAVWSVARKTEWLKGNDKY